MNNTEKLKNYIENVYKLEASIYTQKRIEQNIKSNISKLSNMKFEPYYPLHEPNNIDSNSIMTMILTWLTGFFLSGIILTIYSVVADVLWIWGVKGTLLRAFGIGAIIAIAVFIYMNIQNDKNNSKLAKENDKLKQLNTKIDQNNLLRQQNVKNEIVILTQQLEDIKKTHLRTEDILNCYYNKNIIYPKYRNLIAVASFYEYLASGRCSSLEGHEGAYNIYENEIRLNNIINKLDDVIYKLDQIEANQHMLYQAIKEGNKKAQQLSEKIANIANNLQTIEDNTSLIEYHANITAQNADFIKWLTLFSVC